MCRSDPVNPMRSSCVSLASTGGGWNSELVQRGSFLTGRPTLGLYGAAYRMHVLVASEQERGAEEGNPLIPRYSGECGNEYQNGRRDSHRRGRGGDDHRLDLPAPANDTPAASVRARIRSAAGHPSKTPPR